MTLLRVIWENVDLKICNVNDRFEDTLRLQTYLCGISGIPAERQLFLRNPEDTKPINMSTLLPLQADTQLYLVDSLSSNLNQDLQSSFELPTSDPVDSDSDSLCGFVELYITVDRETGKIKKDKIEIEGTLKEFKARQEKFPSGRDRHSTCTSEGSISDIDSDFSIITEETGAVLKVDSDHHQEVGKKSEAENAESNMETAAIATSTSVDQEVALRCSADTTSIDPVEHPFLCAVFEISVKKIPEENSKVEHILSASERVGCALTDSNICNSCDVGVNVDNSDRSNDTASDKNSHKEFLKVESQKTSSVLECQPTGEKSIAEVKTDAKKLDAKIDDLQKAFKIEFLKSNQTVAVQPKEKQDDKKIQPTWRAIPWLHSLDSIAVSSNYCPVPNVSKPSPSFTWTSFPDSQFRPPTFQMDQTEKKHSNFMTMVPPAERDLPKPFDFLTSSKTANTFSVSGGLKSEHSKTKMEELNCVQVSLLTPSNGPLEKTCEKVETVHQSTSGEILNSPTISTTFEGSQYTEKVSTQINSTQKILDQHLVKSDQTMDTNTEEKCTSGVQPKTSKNELNHKKNEILKKTEKTESNVDNSDKVLDEHLIKDDRGKKTKTKKKRDQGTVQSEADVITKLQSEVKYLRSSLYKIKLQQQSSKDKNHLKMVNHLLLFLIAVLIGSFITQTLIISYSRHITKSSLKSDTLNFNQSAGPTVNIIDPPNTENSKDDVLKVRDPEDIDTSDSTEIYSTLRTVEAKDIKDDSSKIESENIEEVNKQITSSEPIGSQQTSSSVADETTENSTEEYKELKKKIFLMFKDPAKARILWQLLLLI